jgi:hypothetical protein
VPTRVDGKLIDFNQRLTASMNLKEFQGMSAQAVLDVLAEVAEKAKEYAKQNVDKDKGPGPHPHRTDYGWVYEDRGWAGGGLASQIGIKRVPDGIFVHAYVYTPNPVGAYLEIGWRGPSGRFYRYPWLKPAMEKAKSEFPNVARARMSRVLSDSTKGRRAGVIMTERDMAKFIADTDEYNRVLDANKGDDARLNELVNLIVDENIGSPKEFRRSVTQLSHKLTNRIARKKAFVNRGDQPRKGGNVKLSKSPLLPKTKNISKTVKDDIRALRKRLGRTDEDD